jgi:hypothetical protein
MARTFSCSAAGWLVAGFAGAVVLMDIVVLRSMTAG